MTGSKLILAILFNQYFFEFDDHPKAYAIFAPFSVLIHFPCFLFFFASQVLLMATALPSLVLCSSVCVRTTLSALVRWRTLHGTRQSVCEGCVCELLTNVGLRRQTKLKFRLRPEMPTISAFIQCCTRSVRVRCSVRVLCNDAHRSGSTHSASMERFYKRPRPTPRSVVRCELNHQQSNKRRAE